MQSRLSDDLASNYPAGYVVSAVVSSTLAINPSFDGGANQNLLLGTDSLAIGDIASVSFDVTFTPVSTASIGNQAEFTATGRASGSSISVPTTVGGNPTDPTNPTGPTPTGPVEPHSAIGGAKNLDSLVDNGDGSFTGAYTFTIENLGSEAVDSAFSSAMRLSISSPVDSASMR
ncbi:MAG: hypothetical protein R2706_09725 [Acidimicrobiales bacterium]